MGEKTNVSWARISAEAVAIVGSILLAFAIDAWWDDLKDRELEQELLASLIKEFRSTAAAFELQSTRHEQRRTAALKLSALNDELIRELGPENLRQLWLQAYSHDISDPPQGALSGAIASGQLSLIRDSELRSRLAGWSGRLTDLQRTEQGMADYMDIVMASDMSDRALLPYLSAVSTEEFGVALLATSTKNHMNWIVFVTDIAMDLNEQIQAEVSEIIKLLKKEIKA